MQNPFKKKMSKLDKEIDKILEEMKDSVPAGELYQESMMSLERITKVKAELEPPNKPLSRDAVLTTIGSLVGIGIVILFERNGILTTKGLSFLKGFK